MGWRGAGLRALRWVLWLLAAWVFVRGIVSFLPTGAPEPVQTQTEAPQAFAEPDGLRAVPAMFAREFLTWQPGQPDERAERLRPFLARGLDRQAGWSAGRDSVGQEVLGAWTYGVRPVAANRWLVTVAVRVAPYEMAAAAPGAGVGQPGLARRSLPEAIVYLAVPLQTVGGGAVVYDLPSLLPALPPGEAAGALWPGQEVTDRNDAVRTLLTGFFRAYYTSEGDLAYYLTPGLQLSSSRSPYQFDRVSRVTLLKHDAGQHWALAEVQASDPATGARYTFRYTLQVIERDGRWLVQDLLQKGE